MRYFQLAFFLFCNVAGSRIVAILDLIPVSFKCEIAEAVFKIANFSRAERIVGCSKDNGLCPIILLRIALVLLQTIENTLAVLTCTSLPDIYDALARLIRSPKKEVNSALFQVIAFFTLVEFSSRNLIGNTRPVCESAFDSSSSLTVHQE